MDSIKKVLLETLVDFHEFCEKYELDYFLIGGTLLGAVRNQGFIPWDDDVDIVMSRKHYDKLITISNEFKDPLVFRSAKSEEDFRFPFSKLSNSKIIVEECSYKSFISGVWIDIFPLDYSFDTVFFQKIHFNMIHKTRLFLSLKNDLRDTTNCSLTERIFFAFIKPIAKFTPRSLLNLTLSFVEAFPSIIFRRKNTLANLHGAWGAKETAPISVFMKRKLYVFEGQKFWGPDNADYWLTKVYGDYMKLPPIEKRKSHHQLKVISSSVL